MDLLTTRSPAARAWESEKKMEHKTNDKRISGRLEECLRVLPPEEKMLIDHFFLSGSSRFVLSWRSEQDRRRLATTRSTFMWHPGLSFLFSFSASLSLCRLLTRAHRLIKPSIAQLPCCVVMRLAQELEETLVSLYVARCRVTTNHHNAAVKGPIRGRCQLLT